MKPLNKKATRLFVHLFDKLKGSELIIYNPLHPPLRIEKGTEIETKVGPGILYTIGVLQDEKKLRYSAMMQFIVLDQRGLEAEPGPFYAFPILYRDDQNDVEEISVHLKDNRLDSYNAQWQVTHVRVASRWLLDLQTDGYYK